MKYFLLLTAITLSITSCTKEFSQEGQAMQQDFTIEDESGGLNFFLHTKGAEISINIYQGATAVPVNEGNKYYEYEVSASDLLDNIVYTIELQYHAVPASGTFDLFVEGFTASPGTKSFWIRDIPVSVSDAGTKKSYLKMKRSYSKYTFSLY